VSECGARPQPIDRISAIQEIESSPGHGIALVAVGPWVAEGRLGLEVIQTLKQRGFKVICYEDGSQSLPLCIRCQLIVAGSLQLLDSAEPDFARRLKSLLSELLWKDAVQWDEEQRMKDAMREMGLVGESAAMIAVFRSVFRFSSICDFPVLITGETGTGKCLVAQSMHQLDPKRRSGEFVALNCGAISPTLVESELFGHRRGAFTGADRDRKGLIRFAHGGTLFLDEIGDLEGAVQTKLLRVLQAKRVLAVGEDQEVPVSVRVVAATNRDLRQMVQQGKFREDLFQRLSVLLIHIPPLRERPADLGPLIEHFIRKYSSLVSGASLSFDPDFVAALTRINLPGNVRQLENILCRTLSNKKGETPLTINDLPGEVLQELSEQEGSTPVQPQEASADGIMRESIASPFGNGLGEYLLKLMTTHGWTLSELFQHCQKQLLEVALRGTAGKKSQAAQILGLTSRSIYNKIHKFRLTP